jgi:prevent-host-death family protein
MTTMNVAQAKANLSRLLDAAVAGEEVIVARNGTPVVRLVPVNPPASRQLGFLPVEVPDERFEPLGDEDLGAWR